jgi:hypothetical protein
MSSLATHSKTEANFSLTDLFEAATHALSNATEDVAFPVIAWDYNYEDRIGATALKEAEIPDKISNNIERLSPLSSLSWSPGEAKDFSSTLGKRNRMIARSKTFRTSFATVGGASSHHFSRHL